MDVLCRMEVRNLSLNNTRLRHSRYHSCHNPQGVPEDHTGMPRSFISFFWDLASPPNIWRIVGYMLRPVWNSWSSPASPQTKSPSLDRRQLQQSTIRMYTVTGLLPS
ncbi:hypothetical protein Y032_1031g3441 [Ancylostoma ceylanicum]|uniref:Uncharacterized protein n=1 Tax=Ancylostoma ceylanicum TaxID=53326 RepID=A0A016W7H3_9BILA|nr:hypothetical protein Y032_1031g3441 [Ancylostoma ceylanicum]